MSKAVFIKGKRIDLRPLNEKDAPIIYQWHNNPEITKFSLNKLIVPSTYAMIEEFITESNSKRIITLAIDEKKGKFVGYIGLSSLDLINRKAEYFIFIGEKSKWGKGYGNEATRLILNYGFNTLNLHRIELTVSSVHERALKLYKKLGFKEEGRKREAVFRDGKYHDRIIMSILKSEWKK